MYTTQKFNMSLSLQYKLDNLTGRTFNLLHQAKNLLVVWHVAVAAPRPISWVCYISVSYADIGCLGGGFITLVGSTCAGVSRLPIWQPTWPSLCFLLGPFYMMVSFVTHATSCTCTQCTHAHTCLHHWLDLCPTFIVTLVSFCLNSCLLFSIKHLLFHLYHASSLIITATKPGHDSHIVTYSLLAWIIPWDLNHSHWGPCIKQGQQDQKLTCSVNRWNSE